MAVITTDTDERLVAGAAGGDREALAVLLDRHLHPAWRVALAASASPTAAEAAVVTGFSDTLNAANRHPDPTVSLRARIAAAVHSAAKDADRRVHAVVDPPADPVLAAFHSLPVASRTALWLLEVEGGEPAQIAPVLGVERSVATALAGRAGVALRERLAANLASRATDPACARSLGSLAALAAARVSAEDRDGITEHLAGCSECTAWLAAIVTPRPALRRLVMPVPASLPAAIADRWAERGGRDRPPLLRGWSQRAVGAAAAAILAVGLAGAALLGRGSDDGPELAAPAGAVEVDTDTSPSPVSLPDPVLPSGGPSIRVLDATATRAGGDGDRARGADPAPAPPTATPPTTAPPTTTTPTTAPPADDDGSGDGSTPAASSPDDTTQATVEVPGVVAVGVGDCSGANVAGTSLGGCDPTTGEPQVEIVLPGLPPVTLLP